MSVKVVDDRTVEFRRRKGDKEVSRNSWTLSEDGSVLTNRFHDATTPGAPAVEGTTTLTRAGPAPAGAHGVSGKWTPERIADYSEDALNLTYQVSGNTVTSNVQGQSYTAEIGGPAAPVKVVFQAVGETDNGNLWIHSTAKFGFGIYVDEDCTRQYVIFLPDEKGKPGSKHYSMNVNLAYMLALLGQPERMQSSGVDIMDFDLKNDEVFQGKFDEIFVKMAYSDINSPIFTFGKMAIVPAK
mgnify:CR=1 FL=1